MPKRGNPFGDSSRCQLKTHVGEKEVNNGVDRQIRMQSVYEKTHQLLFAGMKEINDRQVLLDANENVVHTVEETRLDKSDLKQMQIGRNCELVNSDDVDMETVSGRYPGESGQDLLSSCSTVRNVDTFSSPGVSESCSQVVPSFRTSLDTAHRECSSTFVVLSGDGKHASEDLISHHSLNTAFSHLKQAHTQKTVSCLPLKCCHNCRQPFQSSAVTRCQFCEDSVCCTCVRHCINCGLSFCQLCSVINYDLPSERFFCLSCHGR